MGSSDPFHNWHLADIQSHDQDNLSKLLSKQLFQYKFKDAAEVLKFTGDALGKALEKHGISIKTAAEYAEKNNGDFDDAGEAVDYLMQEKNVRVEERMDYEGEEQWKCGLYIYKDNEIADFIGPPKPISDTLILNEKYLVITTLDLK